MARPHPPCGEWKAGNDGRRAHLVLGFEQNPGTFVLAGLLETAGATRWARESCRGSDGGAKRRSDEGTEDGGRSPRSCAGCHASSRSVKHEGRQRGSETRMPAGVLRATACFGHFPRGAGPSMASFRDLKRPTHGGRRATPEAGSAAPEPHLLTLFCSSIHRSTPSPLRPSPRYLSAMASSASGITRTAPTVAMKFVSPPQRGTRCACRCSGTPAPAAFPSLMP